MDYRKQITQAKQCSMTWLTENYQHITCWVCDHATCCVLLCFTLQYRITLLFCSTGASRENKQNQKCLTSLTIRFGNARLTHDSPAQQSVFYYIHKAHWRQPYHWMDSLFDAFWAIQMLILSCKKSHGIQLVMVSSQGTGLKSHPPSHSADSSCLRKQDLKDTSPVPIPCLM